MSNCVLCQEDGGHLIWRGDDARVVQIDDPIFQAIAELFGTDILQK
jgi:hypothetical protein